MKSFLGLYYEWGCDMKGSYEKMTMDKDVKKLVEGYENYIGNGVKAQKTPSATSTTLSKSDLEEPHNKYKYSLFVGQLMWYTTKVVPDVANMARYLVVHMSHPGPENWKELGRLIVYLKGKRIYGCPNH